MTIQAGSIDLIHPHSGEWLFVDVGFSSSRRSCGVVSAGSPRCHTFGEVRELLRERARKKDRPLNLVLEAPLSVAFGPAGNPVGRAVERDGHSHRYWYVGLGCAVMTAAVYLVRALHDCSPQRQVRLFEGFVSFKPRGAKTTHMGDVAALRSVVMDLARTPGSVVDAEHLRLSPHDHLVSAFAVAGMDLGIPPVIRATESREAT